MTTFLAVMPVIWAQTSVPCIESMIAPDSSLGLAPHEILVVDNTRHGEVPTWSVVPDAMRYHRDPDGHNLGVGRAWNVGARALLEEGLDYLVILSASMWWGYRLHTTFRAEIEANDGAPLVELMGHSWHAIAIHRSTFERVGLFDPNFWPAYWEATEWGYRLRLVGIEGAGWPRVWCNALSMGQAIHVDRQRWDAPACPSQPLMDYYAAKWGAMSPDEVYEHPFGDPSKPIDWFEEPSIPELAARYGIPKGAWW